jgi:peptidyl-prolyl cis-trans isomerase B (cyclophilin B)
MRRRDALCLVAGCAFSSCTSARSLNPFSETQVHRWVALRLSGKTSITVVIELSDRTPLHAMNLSRLVNGQYYCGLKVHRVVDGRFVQTGDPLSRSETSRPVGTGGPGYTLPPEFGLKHLRGAVAMSRLSDGVNPGQRSNGSQFYFVLKDSPEMDQQNTVFGMVVRGIEGLDEIGQSPVDGMGKPLAKYEIVRTKGSSVSVDDALKGL